MSKDDGVAWVWLARAKELVEDQPTDHGKKAVAFAEQIGADRLEVHEFLVRVCLQGIDEEENPHRSREPFEGLLYEYRADGSDGLRVHAKRQAYPIDNGLLVSIIESTEFVRWGSPEHEFVSVERRHLETACGALFEFYDQEGAHKSAIALAAIQRGLLELANKRLGEKR